MRQIYEGTVFVLTHQPNNNKIGREKIKRTKNKHTLTLTNVHTFYFHTFGWFVLACCFFWLLFISSPLSLSLACLFFGLILFAKNTYVRVSVVSCRAVPCHAMSNSYRKFGQSKTTWTYNTFIVQLKIIFTHDKTINLAKQRKCFQIDDAFAFAIKILAAFFFLFLALSLSLSRSFFFSFSLRSRCAIRHFCIRNAFITWDDSYFG